jgi:predicted CoA-binding protein
MQLLDRAEVVLVVDWPSRDVPDTLAQAGFTVVVQGGPSPDRVSIYEVIAGEVAIRRLARPADRADLLYCHRPVDELPGLVERAADLGAAAVWLQSGLGPDSAKDPTGCWMPADDLRRARRIVEAAGLTFLAEPYIADVARAVGPRVS